MDYNFQFIRNKINLILNKFIRNDLTLLSNDLHEVTVSHKIGEYIQMEFPEWHVDCEYNRNLSHIKELWESNFRPDIVVHIRNTRKNLLVVEVKKATSKPEEIDADRKRVQELTIAESFLYQFGLVIILPDNKETKELISEWYSAGKLVEKLAERI